MLRKRARLIQKDQQMGQITSDGDSETCLQSDVLGQRQKTNSFFNVPGLFVGLSPMSALECDSARSPTSPLDFKLFSNLSTAFRFPKPSQESHQKSWDCNKVGLGSIIVDSLDNDDGRNLPEKPVIPLSNSKTILIGSQIRSKTPNSPTHAGFTEAPKSLPKNYPIFPNTKPRSSNLKNGSSSVLFEIGGDPLETDPYEKIPSFSLDSKRLGTKNYELGTRKVDLRTPNSRLQIGSILKGSDTENKLTESPIPISSVEELARPLSPEEIELSEDYTCISGNKNNCEISAPSPFPTNDFLTYCYYCNKRLEDGKDIYMYRGEKAFCSSDCRFEEISIEEEEKKTISNVAKSENGDNNFEKSIFFAM
ncbi:hypothetical protein RND81_12G173900 [Saponaria officinalis]|uniref:FLZ-type domain-containing protein n=1 Tax=Saponaria officinalis TaxID=3572 RepID=A0AAW1HBT0_SAPOF